MADLPSLWTHEPHDVLAYKPGDQVADIDAGSTPGFKGSKKSTPYAAQRTMEEVIRRMKDMGVEEVEILIRGVGTGRESAVRALTGSGIIVRTIRDRTPIPHGGVRPKKARRV